MAERRVVLSVDVDEWYHCRWATGSPKARWKDTQAFFKEHYHSDRPAGELTAPAEQSGWYDPCSLLTADDKDLPVSTSRLPESTHPNLRWHASSLPTTPRLFWMS